MPLDQKLGFLICLPCILNSTFKGTVNKSSMNQNLHSRPCCYFHFLVWLVEIKNIPWGQSQSPNTVPSPKTPECWGQNSKALWHEGGAWLCKGEVKPSCYVRSSSGDSIPGGVAVKNASWDKLMQSLQPSRGMKGTVSPYPRYLWENLDLC